VLRLYGSNFIDKKGVNFPIKNGVVRIVKGDNYANNFGFQWNKFQKTQIDRDKNNISISKVRFFSETEWEPSSLEGCDVLEVGCGAGRFSQVVLSSTKSNLYSIDLSNAVEANYRNNKKYGDRIKIFQASIYEMPFENDSFDKVFCLGVLQHTPNFKKSIECLSDKVRLGGELVIDFYPINGWWSKICAKYIFRPWFKKIEHNKLLSLIEANVNWLMKLYFLNQKLGIGKIFNRFLPIPDISATIPHDLDSEELRRWVILDTFDMFSPEYDQPQRIAQVVKWVEKSGLKVTFSDYVHYGDSKAAVVRARK
jgi:SAM-dependent methyltransferase